MTLRLDGTGKNIGTVTYNTTTGDIKVVRGDTSQPVSLVVQGKDGTDDWYYSKQIAGPETVNASDIKSVFSLTSDIDLSACKIWLEITDTNGLAYAVGATEAATAKDKLTSITAPQAITVANGTAYDAMNLPATVNIVTEGNTESSAPVTWNTTAPASGSYEPSVLTQQTVTLNGTVTCPDSIDDNGVLLTTTITITISAAGIVGAPTVNLAAGTYTQTVSIKTDQTDYLNIPVSFTVTEAAAKLTAVGKVADISLANGVEKSAAGLQLPSTVKITTSKGDMNASVKWDVKGSAYNQNSTEAQKFSVKGTAALPDGVINPDNLSLVVSVNVTVSRGPIVSDAGNNSITGISSDGNYTTETKITFTAVGAGMDIENPIKGDV